MQPVSLRGADVAAENVLDRMNGATVVHYYGHGYYAWSHPEVSGLKMYSPGNELNLLTMQQISEALDASDVALVVLSACETGMSDVVHSHWREQYVGLPAGFLRAGAEIVIGSLWPVPNHETCLVFSRFYQELLAGEEATSPPQALRRAQLWLLNAPSEEIKQAEVKLLGLERGVAELRPSPPVRGRSHPADWAAFYVVGNGFAKFNAR